MGLFSRLRAQWSGGSRPDPGPAVAGAPAAAAPDPGWRSLPPVQRALADGVRPVVASGAFAAGLATRRQPQLIGQLVHGLPSATVAAPDVLPPAVQREVRIDLPTRPADAAGGLRRPRLP